MFVVWFQNHSAYDLHLFALAPSGIVDLAAHLLVGADADRISLALGQLGTDGAGAVGTDLLKSKDGQKIFGPVD